MINVNSALLTDDLTGVHNNYIRGFIYYQPQPQHCESTTAAVCRCTEVPDVRTAQEHTKHNSVQNLNYQMIPEKGYQQGGGGNKQQLKTKSVQSILMAARGKIFFFFFLMIKKKHRC